MPPRRWSDRDADSLKHLFEQLMFVVEVYTDSTHCLNASVRDSPRALTSDSTIFLFFQNLKQVLDDFSKRKEHEQAQACVICLMSHGEEGFLTSKDGEKVV
jgi:hypothetical protein